MQATGAIKSLARDVSTISISAMGVSEDVPVTPDTPGYQELSAGQVGSQVKVEVELIPPRTSTLSHLRIIEIVGVVSSAAPAAEKKCSHCGAAIETSEKPCWNCGAPQ
ncbi:MAG: zinc ribbon domain-containing protein [Candidatus Nealsonbacteria bacterium]|nr:zinc ribbon domain-containing protein [Candidatus Nealsonbacteria bacterium]